MYTSYNTTDFRESLETRAGKGSRVFLFFFCRGCARKLQISGVEVQTRARDETVKTDRCEMSFPFGCLRSLRRVAVLEYEIFGTDAGRSKNSV